MKAHFIASTGSIKTDIKNYRAILSALGKHNITLTSEWLDNAYKRVLTGARVEDESQKWEAIYRENLDAISRADLILAEVSNSSFFVGFQVACALQMKKPILLLSTHANADGALSTSLGEEIIRFARYTIDDIDSIIGDFITENNMGAKDIRFNFFIDQKILNYLNWASFQTGETKSEIIRGLLEKEIHKSDL